MYRFFNRHLELGHAEAALAERDFRPLGAAELTVWRGHEGRRPAPSEAAELGIVRAIAVDNEAQLAALPPGERLEVWPRGRGRRVSPLFYTPPHRIVHPWTAMQNAAKGV
jgi:hypothetical protein